MTRCPRPSAHRTIGPWDEVGPRTAQPKVRLLAASRYDLPIAGQQGQTGVDGSADQDATSVGVRGTSPAGRGGVFKGGAAQLKLQPSSTATSHPSSGQAGDLFVDKN